MDSSKKSIFMSILFLVVLISLIVGGQIYVNKLQKSDKAKSEKHVSNNDFRLDKKKDYIYYENEKVISDEPEIVFTDVIINLKGADVINASLKSEMDSIRNSVVLLNDNNKDANLKASAKLYKTVPNLSFFSSSFASIQGVVSSIYYYIF